MKKILLLVVFLSCVYSYSIAQYAEKGTGTLRNEIWWFDWAGLNMSNGASKTFATPDGLSITITFSNVTSPTAVPSVMNTWSGAVLHELFDFNNTSIMPALLHSGTPMTQATFSMQVTATRNGNPAPCTFIAADAEASNTTEVTRLTTDGSNWQTVEFYRNSSQTTDPLNGCNTQTAVINDTYGGTALKGQNPVVATTTSTGLLKVDVLLDHQANGRMAIAFGIMAPIDRGDLPASYGAVQHAVKYDVNNPCNYMPPLPSTVKSEKLKLGSVAGDADVSESLDDNANGADEDGVTLFPLYYNTGVYSVLVKFNNTTGSDAWLTGWFDFNRNGVFDNGESTTVTVPDNATSATLTWAGLPTWLAPGTVTDYAVRFRLSSDKPATQNATGFAKDGEVEDYIVPANTLCNINIQTINDRNVCLAQPVTLTTTGTNITSYSWDVPAFLSDANIASPVSTPTSDITYTVTGSNPQGCTAKDQVSLAVKIPPVITINNDTLICPGNPVPLSVSAPGAFSYTWSAQAGLDNYTIATPVARPTVTTTYVVKVDAGTGCVGEDSVKIAVHTFSFGATTAVIDFCAGKPLDLSAWGGDEYTWLAEDNSIIGKASAIRVFPLTTQTYSVIIKENTCNTFVTRSVPVSINRLAVLKTSMSKSNDVDCVTKQATLHVSAPGAVRFSWWGIPGGEINDITVRDPVVTPSNTTTLYVEVWDADVSHCPAFDSIKVIVDKNHLPVTVNNDTTICNGAAVQLSAVAPGAVSYTWLPQTGLNNNAIASPVAQPAVGTTYVVKAKDGQGCFGEDSVTIALHAPPGFEVHPAKAIVCEKEPLQLTAQGGDAYTWLAEDNSLLGKTAAIVVQPTISQTYRVIISAICNNSGTRSIPVTVNTRPTTSVAKTNDIDCSTGQATLHATGGLSYKWDALPGIANTISPNPIVTPPQTTTYFVTITNSKGCSVRDSVTVVADFAKAMSTYPVPSAFTPNNDGRNDCFGLKLWGQVTQLQFQVFNRWGQRVFATTDPSQCWDGTFNGTPLPAGGYAYTINAVTRCGAVSKSGMVMLIR